MTPAVLLAGLAGICAAAALSELLGAPRPAGRGRAGRPGHGRPSHGRPGHGRPGHGRPGHGRPGHGSAGATGRAPAPSRGHLGAMTVLLARIARRAGARAAPSDLQASIAAAGEPLDLTASDVMALKGAGALIGALLALPIAAALPGRLGSIAIVSAPVAGFLAPDLALARRARRRAARMSREVADVLDLLRVAVAAGLPVGRALGEVGHRCSGPLADELRAAATRLALGATLDEVLAELVARAPIDAVVALVAAVGRADRHGAPLAPALESIAIEARAEQARVLRDEAARAAPKIQLVVALVLVPAVMLIVAAVLVRALT